MKFSMDVALEEIIYNRDPPAELTNELLALGISRKNFEQNPLIFLK